MSKENTTTIEYDEETYREVETIDTSAQEDLEEIKAQEKSSDDVDPIEQQVQERLSKMKSNMDRMAKERDEALKKAAEIEQQQKQETMRRLEEEGKLQELSEMKIADLEAKLKVSQEENTRLNRDNVVASALAGLDFRNERSRQLAYRDIVEQLVQNENGSWIHKSSGSNIQDFVVSYSNNEENSFLFRVKANSGAGISNPSGISNTDTKKSLAEMSTQEVLNLAAKGQLGNFNY